MTYNAAEGASVMITCLKPHCRFSVILLALLGVAFSAPRTAAQRGGEFANAEAALPPEARVIVDRLVSLRELDDGLWKMHAGDMPHAEDVNLDESDWQPIARGAKAPNEAVWFRQIYEVPETLGGYDLTGSRIWFQFHAGANGPMPQILYFNGRRVAMGEDLEPIVLFDKARPGDKVVVAVKLLHTVDVKTFRGATLTIDFPETRPNPVDLGEEFLSAAELIPSLAPGDAAPMTTLENAAHVVDIAALDAHDQDKFDSSLKAAQAQLEALRPLFQQATFHLDGNSHIDAAWLWPSTETVDVVHRTFSTALQLMYEYPNYVYTQSAAAYNQWMADKYPDLNDQIKQRIKEGRWEIVGGMWVEPDLNMPSGESLVRQLLVGKRWYKQAYGVDVRIGWNPDSFGYNWQLPQIYKKSGVDYFVTQKMSWNDTNKLPFKLFWWESPDGSKVLTYFPNGYGNNDLNPVRLGEDLKNGRQFSPGLPELLDLYGIGDHGGGPTRAMLDEGSHWMDPAPAAITADGGPPVTPNYQFGTAQSFFSTVEKEIAPESQTWNYQSVPNYQPPAPIAGKIAIPTWDSELYLEFHRGVYTTQANQKHNMRTSEEEVLNAEKWSSLAWLDGQKYPDAQLTVDWEKVLFNQFHDLAAGSGIAVIYRDAQKDYDWVRMSTNGIDQNALDTVSNHINTEAGSNGANDPAIIVFNPLGWDRSGDVTVRLRQPASDQGALSFTGSNGIRVQGAVASIDKASGTEDVEVPVSHVPALGYVVLHEARAKAEPKEPQLPGGHQASFDIGNTHFNVSVDGTTGCITSIRDRASGFDWIPNGACANELQAFHDLPKEYDAWNIDPGTLDVPPTVISEADSVDWAQGRNGRAIRIVRHWQSSTFVQTISIPDNSDIINIDNDIDWHESHILLKAAFPLAVTNNFATYEIPYGTIERPTTRNNNWEKAQFEVPALRWADLSGPGPDGKVYGLSVLNADKYGYDAVGNLLRLTLLRSPKWPDPDADMGEHHFRYALYPHAGTWKDALTVRHGYDYDYPLQAVVTTAHAGSLPADHSFASVSPDNVVLTAVKKAEDAKGLIFRVYEWAGKDATAEFHVPPGATGATVTNLMEEPQGSPLAIAGDVVKVPIHPYEILTIRVDYPQGGPQL